MTYDDVRVACEIARPAAYPSAPFSPAVAPYWVKRLPYALKPIAGAGGVYETVVTAVSRLFPQGAAGPFTRWIRPRSRVVIKPNLVLDQHPLGVAGTICTITHASVVRPVIDMVLAACPDARITICDVPLQSACWDTMMERGGYNDLVAFYRSHGIHLDLLDLRLDIAICNEDNVILKRVRAERDPLGYVSVDLGAKSAFQGVIDQYRRFRITDYGRGTVQAHHNPERNEYLVPRTVLAADVFVNAPKLKTHRKAGLTCAMKNLIGINGDKSWIAHHRAGSVAKGGDEFERFDLKQYATWHLWNCVKQRPTTIPIAVLLKKLYYASITRGRTIEAMKMAGDFEDRMEGSWHGNDTIWRCIADLNHVILHATPDGMLADTPQRRYLAVVDAVVAGEGEGPMQNTPKPVGIVLAGGNPLAVDHAAAVVMGFDPQRIPSIFRAAQLAHFPYTRSYVERGVDWVGERPEASPFSPNRTWRGRVETRRPLAGEGRAVAGVNDGRT